MAKTEHILFCNCRSYPVVAEDVIRLLGQVLAAKPEGTVTAVDDICALAARKNPLLQEMAGRKGLIIAACHPRTVRWVFHSAGVELDESVRFVNMRQEDVSGMLSELGVDKPVCSCQAQAAPATEQRFSDGTDDNWPAWYPVIDYDKCINCRQCLNFCLFNVFRASEEGMIEVVNPQNCKLRCPACARVCPQGAIIFPRYASAPINGGEATEQEGLDEKVQFDLGRLVGEDIYKLLHERSRQGGERFTAAADMDNAIQERINCLQQDISRGKIALSEEIKNVLSQAGLSPHDIQACLDTCQSDCACHRPDTDSKENECACHQPDVDNKDNECTCHQPGIDSKENDCTCHQGDTDGKENDCSCCGEATDNLSRRQNICGCECKDDNEGGDNKDCCCG